LTVPEAASRARVSRKAIYRAAAKRALQHTKAGGHGALLFRPAWVDAWLEQSIVHVEVGR
jgi:excisionase family DNA binding protein